MERIILRAHKKLGEILVESSFITKEQLDEALSEAKKEGKRLGEVLVEKGLISPETLATVLSFQLKVPVVNLRQVKIDPEAIRLIPEDIARKYKVLPISVEGDTLKVAMEDPHNLEALDALEMITKKKIKPALPLYGRIEEFIESTYRISWKLGEEVEEKEEEKKTEPPKMEPESIQSSPVVRAVEMIIAQAIKDRASDIHIIPTKDELKILYRIDGILHEVVKLPLGVHNALISRIKVMAGMNIAEKRRPQDGQFSMRVDSRDVNFRVATIETNHGEMMVLRVLDKSISVLDISELGFQPGALKAYEEVLRSPYGMILVSGPTGSGKTTTLYASLNKLVGKGKNIMTIEDPVEYQFEGVNQIQVNRQAGITFSTGLRAIMRLDPDIILVGEIRDAETADIAVQAALTGHLVLTSIHASDSASAIIRLIDLGVEPFLVTSAVICSLSQRLVRKVCPYCKTLTKVGPDEAMAYKKEMGEERDEFYVGRGCNFCSQTGFAGRIGVFEVMVINEKIRSLILKGASASEIKDVAVKDGMITMRRDGMMKARDGITTPKEVLRNVFIVG